MNDQPSLQAVVFDFFGVLVGGPQNQQARWAAVARRLNQDVESLARFLESGESYQQAQKGTISRQAWWVERMRALGIEAPAEQRLLYQILFTRWPPDPDVLELVQGLQERKVRLALLSNSGGTAVRLRDHYPFLVRFENIFLSGERGVAKPSSTAYCNVERELELPPQALLLVDDSPTNINGARRRGWQTHLFEDAPMLRHELRAWALLG